MVDARPDSRVMAYVELRKPHRFQRFAVVKTNSLAVALDVASDKAVATAVHERLFRQRRHGRFWHCVGFAGLADVRDYLRDHLRFVHRASWTVDDATLRRHAEGRFVIRRAVRYELFERRPAGSRGR